MVRGAWASTLGGKSAADRKGAEKRASFATIFIIPQCRTFIPKPRGRIRDADHATAQFREQQISASSSRRNSPARAVGRPHKDQHAGRLVKSSCSEHDTGTNRTCLRYEGAGVPERRDTKRTGKRKLYQNGTAKDALVIPLLASHRGGGFSGI